MGYGILWVWVMGDSNAMAGEAHVSQKGGIILAGYELRERVIAMFGV